LEKMVRPEGLEPPAY